MKGAVSLSREREALVIKSVFFTNVNNKQKYIEQKFKWGDDDDSARTERNIKIDCFEENFHFTTEDFHIETAGFYNFTHIPLE